MKTTIVAYLAASMLAVGMPVMAAEHAHMAGDEQCIKECQMLIKNCAQEVDSIQQKISKLNKEIAKGASTYTRDELKKLVLKLKEVQGTLNELAQGG